MNKLCGVSIVACSLLGGSLFAADNLVEITPQIGGSYHISNDRYKNNMDLVYGLKFANRVSKEVLVEVGYEYSNIDYAHNVSASQNRYYLNLIKEFYTESSVSPYILGGFGYEDFSKNFYNMDDDMFGQYGVGIRWAIASNFHLKTELRHLMSFDGRSDIVATLGFSIPFGKYVEESEVVEITEVQEAPKEPVLSHIHTFKVQFPFDSAVVNPKYYSEIKDFALYMQENKDKIAVISGHTDSVGSDEYNQRLSENRAKAVKEKIVQEGVESSRLQVKGYGESRPISDNSTTHGRMENRRVEAEVYNVK